MAKIFLAAAFAAMSLTGLAESPWIEADSLRAIEGRIARDFSLTLDEGRRQIRSLYPALTDGDIDRYIKEGSVECRTMTDGSVMMFRKSPKNLPLIDPALRQADGWTCRGSQASYARRASAAYIIGHSTGDGTPAVPQRITINFRLTVPDVSDLAGDTLRVWMPMPMESSRQSDIELISASTDDYIISPQDASVHRTIYMQHPVREGEKEITFDYTFAYTASAQYFAPDTILSRLRPYDKTSPLYKEYTRLNASHTFDLTGLARAIVGQETNPFRQSELVYDYIVTHYPWAGAREYSTIDCIPAYVVEHGYGDCGQVSLLYISLMRSLGIPARWESGWMLHPGEKNFHDWAEVYFEGVGWVPVDTSFGRYTADDDKRVRNFHSTGQDNYRFASNRGVAGNLYPAKRWVRSETVDFQSGEVECSRGNMFYPLWNSTLTILSVKPIDK